jgi:hypothetical protein
VKNFLLILLLTLVVTCLPASAADPSLVLLTNLPTATDMTGARFLMNTRISGSKLGVRQVEFDVVAVAMTNSAVLSQVAAIASALDTSLSNSLRSLNYSLALGNTNYSTAISNFNRSLSYSLAAALTNNSTLISNGIIAYVDANGGGSTLTNFNNVETRLVTNGAVRTISAGSNFTITDNGTNLVLSASLSGGAASLGDITNTVTALAIANTNGTGTGTTLINPTFSGGDWSAVTNGFLPQYFYRLSEPIPWVCIEEFDTDCDDYGHLAVLLSLEKAGIIKLIYVATASPHPNAVYAVKSVLHSYGRDTIPVGQPTNTTAFGYQTYVQDYIVTNYTSAVRPSITNETIPELVPSLREVLAAQADNSVVITVGSPCGLLNQVLNSVADGYSSLDGYSLLTNKLRRDMPSLVLLAGYYPTPDNIEYIPRYQSTTVSAIASTNTFFNSANNFPTYYPGQTISVTGFATATNNQNFYVLSATSSNITVLGNYFLADEAAGSSVLINFASPEYNIHEQAATAAAFINNFTNFPVYFVESGTAATPHTMQSFRDRLSEMNPVSMAYQKVVADNLGNYELYLGRSAWGQTTALYPLFGTAMGLNTSGWGSNYAYSATGDNVWTTNASGFHKYVWWNTNETASRIQGNVVSHWEAYGKPDGKGLPRGAMLESDYTWIGRYHDQLAFRTWLEGSVQFNYPVQHSGRSNDVYGTTNGAAGALIGMNTPGYQSSAYLISTNDIEPSAFVIRNLSTNGMAYAGPDGRADLVLSNEFHLKKGIAMNFSFGTNSPYGTFNWNRQNTMFTDQPTNLFAMRYQNGFAMGGTGSEADYVFTNISVFRRGIPIQMENSGALLNATFGPNKASGTNGIGGLSTTSQTNAFVIRPASELVIASPSGTADWLRMTNANATFYQSVNLAQTNLNFLDSTGATAGQIGTGPMIVTGLGTGELGIRVTGTNGFAIGGTASGSPMIRMSSNYVTSIVWPDGTQTGVPSGGSATNAIGSTYTNNVLVGSGQTQIEFTNGANTTVSAVTTGGRTTYTINSSGGGSGIPTSSGSGTNTTLYTVAIQGGTAGLTSASITNGSLYTPYLEQIAGASSSVLYMRNTNTTIRGTISSEEQAGASVLDSSIGDIVLRNVTSGGKYRFSSVNGGYTVVDFSDAGLHATNAAFKNLTVTNLVFSGAGGTQTRALTNSLAAGSGISLANNGSGTMTISATGGGAGGTKTIASWFASDNKPPTNNYAVFTTLTGAGFPVDSLRFNLSSSATTNWSAVFRGRVPEGADLTSGLRIRLDYAATNTTGGIGWKVAPRLLLNTASAWGVTNTISTATVPGTAQNLTNSVTTYTLANLPSGFTNGSLYEIQIQSDTNAISAFLIGVEVQTQ